MLRRTVILMGLCSLAADASAQENATRPTVAVIEFNNSSLVNAAEYAPLSKGMADLLGSSLRGNPAIRVVERDALQAVLREQDLAREGRMDNSTAAKVGRLLGAQYLIKGTFFIEPKGRVRLVAQAVNSTTGEVAYSESSNGNVEDILSVIDQLADRINGGLRLGDLNPPKRSREPAKTNRWAAIVQYSRALEADDAGNVKGAVALYNEFLSANASDLADQRRHAEQRVRVLAGGS